LKRQSNELAHCRFDARRWPRPAPQRQPTMIMFKHTLHLLQGNPCPCSRSTTPSSVQTTLPSNSQSQRCNRRARTMSCIHLPDSGSLCHAPGSTTPFSGRTNLLANWQNHPRNCKGLLGPAVASVGHRCGGSCSTTAAWLAPNRSTVRLRNCKDQQVRRGQAALWAAAAGASGAAWAAAWGAG